MSPLFDGERARFYDRYGREYPVRNVDIRYSEPHLGRVVIGSTEYRYKPDWRMDYGWNEIGDCGYLSLVWAAPDAYHPERSTKVQSFSTINPRYDITGQVYEALRTAEMHELNEFFVVDGKRPFDPHQKGI